MQKIGKNEEAVSPVIGVILMVAITVILAAVIAAFVFGMAGTTGKTKNVAATAQMIGNTVVVTYQGGPDSGALNATLPLIATDNGGAFSNPFGNSVAVGAQANTTHIGGAGTKDHIVVTATFTDGTTQVILDTQI